MAGVRVLAVASEIYPLVKTGGLADVAGALPKALAQEDVAVTTLVPGYPAVLAGLRGRQTLFEIASLFGAPARLVSGSAADLALFVLEAPHLFDRAGNPYLAPDGRDWVDNPFRFAALAQVAVAIAQGSVLGYRCDVVHAHDWQAALVPAYLHYGDGPRVPTVVTVHNLAFQGLFPAHLLPALGLPAASLAVDGVEFYGSISFLKAGLQFADRITTVSPTYAAEIVTPADGMGLDGLLRARSAALSGIVNGIDVEVWDPAADGYLAAAYDAASLEARAVNTAALQTRLGLDVEADAFCIGAVSRFTSQKGLDLLLELLPQLVADGAQLALLGAGERALEDAYGAAAAAYPGRVGCVIGYDESLAHQIQAGATVLLVPSRFEPCGLTQLCALRYGAVPVVTRVGGLADTVIDANEMALGNGVATGFQFAPPVAPALARALARARDLHRDPAEWARMQRNGMTTDVSWRRPAARYAALYRELTASRGAAS